MQVALKDKLPQEAVSVSVEIQASKTAEEVAGALVKLVEGKRPTLVIWQTGTVDAMRSIDPDEFRTAIDDGVVAMQKAEADVVLINPQYSPRTETMISVPPYLDNIRAVAQQHDIPLFDRFAIMHQWNDQGDFDLFSAHHGPELAKRVHDCLGKALAAFVVDTAHFRSGAAELGLLVNDVWRVLTVFRAHSRRSSSMPWRCFRRSACTRRALRKSR